jgi:5-methylcytosine-specific restriction protein A
MPTMPPIHRPQGREAKPEARRRYDLERQEREAWRAWYKTAAWSRIRKAQLAAEPLCAMCQADGAITAATICDHVEPHRGDLEAFFAGPFQSLCASHHSSTKQSEEKRAAL